MGDAAKQFIRERTGGRITKDVDVIAIKANGNFILGEGKGGTIQQALNQFDEVGKVLGSENIAGQHVTAKSLTEGFTLNKSGWLMSGGRPKRVHGTIVTVTLTV